MLFVVFCLMVCQIVLAGERPPLWNSMMSCQEVQGIMESKRGQRRGDLYTGRCDPNVLFENAPRPWDIVRLLDEQRPSLVACLDRLPHWPLYSANVRIRVFGSSGSGGSEVAIINSTAGETVRAWQAEGQCIHEVLRDVPFPVGRKDYRVVWHFVAFSMTALPPSE